MTDIIPSGACTEAEDGSKTCLNCNYFEDEPEDEEKPWHLCEKPGMPVCMSWTYQKQVTVFYKM